MTPSSPPPRRVSRAVSRAAVNHDVTHARVAPRLSQHSVSADTEHHDKRARTYRQTSTPITSAY